MALIDLFPLQKQRETFFQSLVLSIFIALRQQQQSQET